MPDDAPHPRIQTACLLVLVAVAITYMVFWLRPVLVPLVVAFFVVSGVSPVLTTLESRLGVNRIVAAGLTFLAGVVVLVVFGCSIWVSIVDLSANAPAYRKRVGEIVNRIDAQFPRNLFASDEETPEPPVKRSSVDEASKFVDQMVRDGISVVTQALVSLVSTSVVVLIYVFFLLIGTPAVNQSPTIREVDQQIRSYLSLKTVISIFTGLAFGVALRLFGVPMAFTFGVMAFLLNFVPNVGPIVASLLPIPLIILDPNGSLLWMVATISVVCTIQMISGNFVEPKIMGNSSDLHPVTILVGLMFWGMMWGIIGMFLATPIMAAIKIVLGRIETTRPIADLMAGRWTFNLVTADPKSQPT
ncbi:MAG: AI-2E family transporter [Rubripirellula sp.]